SLSHGPATPARRPAFSPGHAPDTIGPMPTNQQQSPPPRKMRPFWRFTLRELVLVMVIVALSVSYYRAIDKRFITTSPFWNSFQVSSTLQSVAKSLGTSCSVSGGGGGGGGPRFFAKDYHYDLTSTSPTPLDRG